MEYKSNIQELQEVKKGCVGRGLLIEHDGYLLNESDNIKQIKEDITHGAQFVLPDGPFIVSAVFQKYGIKNANGRIYPENVLRPAVSLYIENRVYKHCAIGSLDHPQSSTLSGHDVSHNIVRLEWQNHTLIGDMEIHLSPGYRKYGVASTSGDLLANMLLQGILVGVSSRALGEVQKVGDILMVTKDLEIISWDAVCEPSTPDAWIAPNKDELKQFIESDTTSVNKKSINEEIEQIRHILG